ncbi:MAG: YceI family protein [Bryobacteraceae bacterium]
MGQIGVIDTQRSSITVHVGKAGLFSFAGHEHLVNAPISSGEIVEGNSPRIEFTIETAKMTVKPDPKIDAKTQAQIQKDMDEMTLEPARYPRIIFHSTRVEKSGADRWRVTGDLSLHGVTRPVIVNVIKGGDAYQGRAEIKQTDFGIKPVSVAGGSIKVKDQITIDFQIFAAPG